MCFPVTPYDAKGLMNAALQGTDPVVFFESQRAYDVGEQFHEGRARGVLRDSLWRTRCKEGGERYHPFLTVGHTSTRR